MTTTDMLRLTGLLTLLLAFAPANRAASAPLAASVTIPDFTISRGETFTATADITGDTDFGYSGFQLDLTLPADLTLERTALPASLEEFRLESVDLGGGRYRIVAFAADMDRRVYEDILSLTFRASGTAAGGSGEIAVSKVIFSAHDARDIYLGDSSCTVTVKVPATGISVGKATLLEPSFTSSTASVGEITLGESLSVEVDLLPEGTTDSVEDIEWSFSGAEGIGLTMDGSGNLTVNTENAVIGGSPAEVTVTGTLGGISASFTIQIKSVLLGDSNANGRVTVADVVTSANVSVGNRNVDEFCFPNANVVQTEVDGRQAITPQDITATVGIILEQSAGQRNARRHPATFHTNDRLVADDFSVPASGETSIGVRLEGANGYSALQASVAIPEGMTVTDVVPGPRAASHQLVYHVADDRVNLMLYSLRNATFAGSGEPLFYLRTVAREDCGDLGFENVNAADAASNGYFLYGEGGRNVTGTTGVDAIETDEGVRYYDLNGMEIRRPDSGVYIRVDAKGNAVKVLRF